LMLLWAKEIIVLRFALASHSGGKYLQLNN
jgi:hypothetical protein